MNYVKAVLVAAGLVLGLSQTEAYGKNKNEQALNDAWITSKAKLALWTTGGIKSTAVNVDTNNGVVTIYGKVATANEKNKAGSVVKKLDGVKEVNNLLQVVSAGEQTMVTRSDDATKQAAEAALQGDSRLSPGSVKVRSVDKGVVLLEGTPKTIGEQLAAITDVEKVEGVHGVRSEMKTPDHFSADEMRRFETTPGEGSETLSDNINDIRITTGAKLRLLGDGEVPSSAISVDTNGGRISLFGVVATAEQKSKAEADVQKVSGMTGVDNYLQVVPKSRQKVVKAEDQEIKKHLEHLLSEDPDFKQVDVAVANGVIRLTGTVPTSWDRLHLAMISRASAGARSVDDELKVSRSSVTN